MIINWRVLGEIYGSFNVYHSNYWFMAVQQTLCTANANQRIFIKIYLNKYSKALFLNKQINKYFFLVFCLYTKKYSNLNIIIIKMCAGDWLQYFRNDFLNIFLFCWICFASWNFHFSCLFYFASICVYTLRRRRKRTFSAFENFQFLKPTFFWTTKIN